VALGSADADGYRFIDFLSISILEKSVSQNLRKVENTKFC